MGGGGWLVGWLVGRLVGFDFVFVGKSGDVGWLAGWSVGRSVDRSVGWLVGWLVICVFSFVLIGGFLFVLFCFVFATQDGRMDRQTRNIF